MSRGFTWIDALSGHAARPFAGIASVLVADFAIDDVAIRAIAVVPDPLSADRRARNGEIGVREAYAIAAALDAAPSASAVLALVDAPGQAFGRAEEDNGIHAAFATAVGAYAEARLRTPVLALVVGRAISGAFLAHGLQAAWLGALRDAALEFHVMSADSVARVTRTTRDEVERLAAIVPATARDLATFARFGALDAIVDVASADAPTDDDVARVRATLAQAARDRSLLARTPADRLLRGDATRAPSQRIRAMMDAEWA
jgi:biotin-independent malonate decarboxylase gamma subunit